MIIYHFHINPQFIYESFHIHYTKKVTPTKPAKEIVNSADYFVNVQLTKFILTCLDLRNTLLSNQTDVR